MTNLLRTNTKEYKERIYKYLLESIDFEDLEGEEITDRQKIDYLFAHFESEYGHEKRRTPNEQERLKGWLMGLPSYINIAFYNYDILELAKELHNTKVLTEKEENKILENYWDHIAFMLLKLKRELR